MTHRSASRLIPSRVAWLGGWVFLAACSGTPAPTTAQTTDLGRAAGVEKTLFIAPERKPCTGVGPMQCLQVREAVDRPWQHFYSEIEGFTHEPGYAYELRVREETVMDPPADGSSLRWQLLDVVSKVRHSNP